MRRRREGERGGAPEAYFCRRNALLQTVEEGRDANLMQINSASGRRAIVRRTGTNARTSEVSTSWTGLFSSLVVATVGLVMPRLRLPFVGPPFSTVAVESPSDMVGKGTRARQGEGEKRKENFAFVPVGGGAAAVVTLSRKRNFLSVQKIREALRTKQFLPRQRIGCWSLVDTVSVVPYLAQRK